MNNLQRALLMLDRLESARREATDSLGYARFAGAASALLPMLRWHLERIDARDVLGEEEARRYWDAQR